VRTAAVDLTSWAEVSSDAHIHFDDPMFAGLVPDFADVERRRTPARRMASRCGATCDWRIGWVSGYRDREAGVWWLSLMYETPQPSK
jgi:hypothetical protein